MPTVRIEYWPYTEKVMDKTIAMLADKLPGIVAPQMNIGGRELHDGGVSENEIIVDASPYSNFARNVNDIQVTVIAHAFLERQDRLDLATETIRDELKVLLADIKRPLDQRPLEVGVSIWLIDMGYATF